MQLDTDFEHPMKLNCSSIASSTPGNNVSFPENQLIRFEQFNRSEQQKTERSQGHKKRLTIEINDSYDFNQSESIADPSESGQQFSATDKEDGHKNFFKKHEKVEEISGVNSQFYGIGQSQSPTFSNSCSEIQISKIAAYNSFLEEKLKQLEQVNCQLKNELSHEKSQCKGVRAENQSLKAALRKKQEAHLAQKDRNSKLSQKIAQLQEKQTQHVFYDEKLREKQAKITELQRKLEKITTMNKNFQRQLKQSDRKIMELEKDLQRTFCQNQQQVISRIKESSVKVKQPSAKSRELIANKENQSSNVMSVNNMGNTMGSTIQMRKSIEKKKCSQSQGKKKLPLKTTQAKGQRTSSTSNIVSKKLLTLKKD